VLPDGGGTELDVVMRPVLRDPYLRLSIADLSTEARNQSRHEYDLHDFDPSLAT
jgi:hypothetical protein